MATKNALKRPPALGRTISFATVAVTQLCNNLLEEHDLSLPQWVVLSALWQAAPLSVGDIAKYSGNAVPATSRILDRMIAKDLIKRVPDPNDRRAVQIALTERGQTLDHLAPFWDRVNHLMTKGMTEKEIEQAFDLLGRIETNCREALSKTK